MIDQDQFCRKLTQILTPLAFRESAERKDRGSDADISAWYDTPAATVAAARSSVVHGSNLTAQTPPAIRHAGWGKRRLPEGPCPDEDTLFQACSISKAFQSLAVLHFHSEGVIRSLDDPVKTKLGKTAYEIILQNSVRKGVPEELSAQLLDRMTITQLLSHTAGTTASGFLGYPPQSGHVKTSAEVLQGGLGNANSPPVYIHGISGVQSEYSGGGSTILQAMLENIAGELGFPSYASLMKAKVLTPLGMTRSFYCDAAPLQQSEDNFAAAYQNGTYPLENGQSFHVYPEQGAAGLWTTSLDLVKGLVGVAHTAHGTPLAVKLQENPWIKPEVAQEIFKKRPELGHNDNSYYCGFAVEFLDGEDEFTRDKRLVRISHAGGNEGYRCWNAASFPLPGTVEEGDEVVVHAMACMTNSNHGGGVCGPMVSAVSEIVDGPLGAGPPGGPFSDKAPFVALDPGPSAPSAGWEAYEGQWAIENRAQTLEITTGGAGPSVGIVFSHLEGVVLPLVACAARTGPEMLRLRVSSLDVTLDFGNKGGESSLSLCTGGARLKCTRSPGTAASAKGGEARRGEAKACSDMSCFGV
ncbi:hypothetical protein diail_895 [Diaporthe ilicicola]|nr:hypothetical protein diail_895 [Diaporthe ilicicola]